MNQFIETLRSLPVQTWIVPVVGGLVAHGLIGLAGLVVNSIASPSRFWGPTDQQVATALIGGCVLWILQCLVNTGIGFLFVRQAAGMGHKTKHLIAGGSLAAFVAFVPLSTLIGLLSLASQGSGTQLFSSRPTISTVAIALAVGFVLNSALSIAFGALGGYVQVKTQTGDGERATNVGEPLAEADS